MTFLAAKEKLHDYIDHAGETEVFKLLSLFESGAEQSHAAYDEAALNILRERSAEYLSGRSITYSLEESRERINKHRKHQ